MRKQKVDNKIAFSSLGSVLLISALFMYGGYAFYQIDLKKEEQAAAILAAMPQPQPNYFKNMLLEAQAAYVYDVTTGKVLYQKNADLVLPLASITKVMTAVVASEQNPIVDSVTISAEALASDGESGLTEGEIWKLEDLLAFTLINSSNDGAQAIADAFPSFIDMMNSKARALGLTTLSFKNPTGLDIDATGEAGGYGSAKDVAKLFEYILTQNPTLLEPTAYASREYSSLTATYTAKNTNTIIGSIPNLLASKTGYTLKAGGNLAVVFDRGLSNPVIAVVLGSSQEGRFLDIMRLASSTLATYNESQ
jgi:D-alanyl-D-alanine carboxypeptidase (penicillin-binding protein 5/6)